MSPPNDSPSLNGCNGRGPNGRFAPGNKLGKGNPHGRAVNQLRSVLFEVVTPERFRNAVEAVLAKAERGDRRSLAELCDRMLGRPSTSDLVDRVARLEEIIEQHYGQ